MEKVRSFRNKQAVQARNLEKGGISLISVGKDDFLEERLARLDKWIKERKIPASSEVIPVLESLAGLQ